MAELEMTKAIGLKLFPALRGRPVVRVKAWREPNEDGAPMAVALDRAGPPWFEALWAPLLRAAKIEQRMKDTAP